MAATPNSYKDPYWSDLAGTVEAKLDLPKGLLVGVVTRGERSNADQVSEAGAKTPFQIIPATRKAAIDKWGIDPYLSPENAAEVAGKLLRESLDRNQNDPKLAVAEYIGGTDRKNWGPTTRAYVQRVVGAQPPAQAEPVRSSAPASTVDLPVAGGQSTFQRVLASQQAAGISPQSIASVYAAYQGGQMSPEEAQEFEADVQGGKLMLPRGAALKTAPPADQAPSGGTDTLPDDVIAAYVDGRMGVQDRAELERDVKAGTVKLPKGITLGESSGTGILDRLRESITGAQRATPQTEALPDWADMPELNSASMASAKAGLGTLFAQPEEAVKVIQANFPGVQVTRDQSGNFLLQSSINGKQYAIKPGFQTSDIPRAIGALAAFTPAGRAATIPGAVVAGGATQAAIEGTQAATGGEFNPGEVAAAAALGGAVPAISRVVGATATPARNLVSRLRGVPEPIAAPVPPGTAAAAAPAAAAAATPAAAPAAATAAMGAEDLAQTARRAADGGLGSGRATATLAEQAAPDAATVAAARRLGIEEHLQPDHVTTSQAYRELAQAVKSIPGSQARAAELEGLQSVARRAEKLIDDIGGTSDVSTLDATVKARMRSTVGELEQQADDLYAQVRQAIPAKTEAPATSTISFLRQHADELGGEGRLLPTEKKLLGALGGEDGPVTYAMIDQTRKQIGQALRKASGPFADSESGLLKRLYGTLSEDQLAVADAQGAGDLFRAANAAVVVRKGIEDDLVGLFGKTLDGSLVGSLSSSMRAASRGDVSGLNKLLASVPEEMRQQVVASGLASAFKTAGTREPISFGTYAKWYEGLLRNRQAHAAVMSNLPGPARKQLSDLYRISKAISAATKERITTGRIQAVQDQFRDADSLAGRIYAGVTRHAASAAAGAAAGAVAGPGVGAVVASALSRGARPNALRAADALIASPEFVQATRGGVNQSARIRAFANSRPFARYMRALGERQDPSSKERWVRTALLAENSTD
jgi:hypothetical protein